MDRLVVRIVHSREDTNMVTRAPAHPVYAKREDAHQRGTQAESEAGAYFERCLWHFRNLPVAVESESILAQLEIDTLDALRDLFVAGWNAAREEQNR
jgi:hypothetical protein